MKKTIIYSAWVESAAGGSWEGRFSMKPETSDILEALGRDILDLNPTIEHEADRIRDYQRLQEVVYHSNHLKKSVTKVIIADVELGEIIVAEETIFAE